MSKIVMVAVKNYGEDCDGMCEVHIKDGDWSIVREADPTWVDACGFDTDGQFHEFKIRDCKSCPVNEPIFFHPVWLGVKCLRNDKILLFEPPDNDEGWDISPLLDRYYEHRTPAECMALNCTLNEEEYHPQEDTAPEWEGEPEPPPPDHYGDYRC